RGGRGGGDDQMRDEAGPAGLVAGAQTRAGVSVEVLVERHEIPPVLVLVEPGDAAVDGPAAVGALEEDRRQAPAQLVRDLVQVHPLPRPGRALDAEVVAEEAVEALEGL